METDKKKKVDKKYFIHKQSGRIRGFTRMVFNTLGDSFLREWTPVADTPEEVAQLQKPEPIVAEQIVVEGGGSLEPETEKEEAPKLTVREIMSNIGYVTDNDLQDFLKDERVSVRKAAEAEIKKRSDYGNQE